MVCYYHTCLYVNVYNAMLLPYLPICKSLQWYVTAVLAYM
jgi:hypothetical protein